MTTSPALTRLQLLELAAIASGTQTIHKAYRVSDRKRLDMIHRIVRRALKRAA